MRFSVEALADLQEAEVRLAALARASRREPLGRLNVLVGSNLQRLSFRRRLAEALGPTGNIRFFTPVDLAVAVRERGAAPARSPLPDGADTLLVDGALRELRAEGALRQLRPSAGGVAEAVASSLTDLREGRVSAADYRAALGAGDDPKLHDLAAVYTRFTSQIAAFRDRSSLYEDALDARLPDAAYREALGGGPLLVAGIYDAPAVQLALLQRSARVVDVHVLLVAPALPAFGVARRFAAMLADAGAEPADDEPEARATSARLDYFSAPSRQAEAEEITRRVLALAADTDIPFHAMAVLHRLDHAADDAIAAALTRAGVPVYRAAGRPLRHTATGRAALVLLDLLLQEPQRHRLLEFVGSPAAAAAFAARGAAQARALGAAFQAGGDGAGLAAFRRSAGGAHRTVAARRGGARVRARNRAGAARGRGGAEGARDRTGAVRLLDELLRYGPGDPRRLRSGGRPRVGR